MKKNLLAFVLILAVCAGCSTHYDITLNNGMVITAHGKPHLDKEKGRYLYTDASGKPDSVSVLRVLQIAPQSMRANKPKRTSASNQ